MGCRLRRVLSNDAAPLRIRVAASLVLLFAQPLTRIVCLTTDDSLHDCQQVHLRLGDPTSSLPTPSPTSSWITSARSRLTLWR
ncbi:hypothetical protein [Streptomyces lydicus]|uniref:hypothetical protein n=1 Tax=Streptomyces lydicus TaxID=47763 RepID=UPI0013E95346|nr:hypothetical protein [Streptomyces lydicus]